MHTNVYVTKNSIDTTRFWKSFKPLLGHLDIELTERCNNNCSHCYINLPEHDRAAQERELSIHEIKNILTEAALLGCISVRFTGGEPFLREDFRELYIFARKLGLKVFIFTNATLITASMAELLSQIPPLEKIEVTVYGLTEKSYEAVTRTPGSFDSCFRGIQLLLEKKIPFFVKGVTLACNKNELDDFEKWAGSLPWMEKPPARAMFFDLRCRRDDKKSDQIRKIRISPEEGLKILIRREQVYIKEMKQFCSHFMRPSGDTLFPCSSGCGGGCVDAYGNFQPCMLLRHPDTVYDLKKGSLKDALENFFPKIRKLRSLNPHYLNTCAKCFLKGLCEQCPAKSWMEHGTLDTPVAYLCDSAHAQARYLGLLKDNEQAWEVENWEERIKIFCTKEESYDGTKC